MMKQQTIDFTEDYRANTSKPKKQAKKQRVIPSSNTLLEKLFAYEVNEVQLDDETIDTITSDLTVTQSDESRKSSTEKKELIISSKNELHVTLLKECFSATTISQILDTYMYGFNVFEVNWVQKQGLWLPLLKQRDYREFLYDEDEELKFFMGGYHDIEEYKVITATYRKRFNKPYGVGVINKIYLPIQLKKASLGFWSKFLEKFGSPWAVAKSDQDLDMMADEVHAMLNGDTAVIDPEESIELLHPDGSRGDFDKLIEYCDSQINRAILGANLTGNVTGGSHAATQVHNMIREDLATSDRKILEQVLNTAIRYFKEINHIDDEITAHLKDEDDPKTELSVRDKTIADMGYRPTKSYIETTYNIEVEEIKQQIIENKTPFKERLKPNKTPFKEDVKAREHQETFNNIVESFLENVNLTNSNFLEIVEKAESYEDILEALPSLKNINQEKIQEAILISELYGMIQDV